MISVERTTRNRHFLRGSNGAIGSTTTRTRTGIEAGGTAAEEASPRSVFLEEWQQKYRESEERYRAERDEAFRSEDEVTRDEERLAAERAAGLKKRAETIALVTARLGVLWSEVTGSSRPVPSEIRLTSTGTEMTDEEHVATAAHG